jgi:hypothetical protein
VSGDAPGSTLLLADVAVQVLLRSALYTLRGYKEHDASAHVHVVVGFSLQVMDDQGCPHPPVKGGPAWNSWNPAAGLASGSACPVDLPFIRDQSFTYCCQKG